VTRWGKVTLEGGRARFTFYIWSGNLDYLEVMNHTRVLDDLKNSPYTEEDDKALEDLGI